MKPKSGGAPAMLRAASIPEIAEAVFDSEKREHLLTHGLSSHVQLTESYFSDRTFELLEDLHNEPTTALYLNLKDEFKEFVEGPFQQLVHDVASQLPAEITNVMETEQKLFSRIPKNDFGRGGAWSHYWGAFYPKGGKRIKEAQLFLGIHPDILEYGFYIGEYGNRQRDRFLYNCKTKKNSIIEILSDTMEDQRLLFGKWDKQLVEEKLQNDIWNLAWTKWLSDPENYGIRISNILTKKEVLSFSAEELVGKISDLFEHGIIEYKLAQ